MIKSLTSMVLFGCMLFFVGCSGVPNSSDDLNTSDDAQKEAQDQNEDYIEDIQQVGKKSDISAESISGYFTDKALVEDITVVECTLSDGTASSCYKIVVTQGITEEDIGPSCPRNIADGKDAGGTWFDDGQLYEIDGEFIAKLATFYDDDSRQLYDEATGDIRVTDTKEAFDAAARPDVAEEYQNHCVEGQLSFVEEIPTEYYYIPVNPMKASTTQSANNGGPLGVAFNGIRIEAPAPVANILAANTIAAFDDCGGHINPYVGYHYHAENGCAPRIETENHPDLIGYALDGFQIYEYDDSLSDLDECGGHTDEVREYHYHLANPGLNQQLGCFAGAYGCTLPEDGTCDASANTGKRGGGPGAGGGGDRPSRDEAANQDNPVEALANSVGTALGLDNIVSSGGGKEGYLGSYGINDETYGTQVKVAVQGDVRSIVSNALPNHKTGEFPNEENPNSMSAQENSYEIPIGGEYIGGKQWQREPGIAINGIKFEPETNERVNCESGEQYRIEGKQSAFPVMGIDHENAHVQPTGTYHYHGLSKSLVEFGDTGNDIVHIGFAKDGFNIYYSKSGAYQPSYRLVSEPRVGTECTYRDTPVLIEGTIPDGTYATDRVFDTSVGDLDSCNGIEIDGEYMYFATDDFPYLPRCLNGEIQGGGGGQGGPGGAGGPPPGGAGGGERPAGGPGGSSPRQ